MIKKFVLPLLLLTMVASCKKENSNSSLVADLSATTKEVISKTNLREMKSAQNLLSDAERQELWKTKYSVVLKNDAGRLTRSQEQILKLLSSFLEKNGITGLRKNPVIGDEFLKANLVYFEKHFTKAQLYGLIEAPILHEGLSVYNMEEALLKVPPPGGGGLNCLCRYDLACPGAGNSCDDGGCNQSTDGCGVFGTSSCTGRCAVPG